MTAYLDLENYLKGIIRSQIGPTGFVESGRLKYMVNLHLAAGPSDGTTFSPCQIDEEDYLIVHYKRGTEEGCKRIKITDVIQEALDNDKY